MVLSIPLITVLLNLYDMGEKESIHNHQTVFNLPLLSSFYYYKGIYGVACWIGTAKIGVKNCHQQRLQLKILPRQQV